MKLFIPGASTIPVVTPVATATTLPPSITALQQQGLRWSLITDFISVLLYVYK